MVVDVLETARCRLIAVVNTVALRGLKRCLIVMAADCRRDPSPWLRSAGAHYETPNNPGTGDHTGLARTVRCRPLRPGTRSGRRTPGDPEVLRELPAMTSP